MVPILDAWRRSAPMTSDTRASGDIQSTPGLPMDTETADRIDAYFREAGITLTKRARIVLIEMIDSNGGIDVTDDSHLAQPLKAVNSALTHLIDKFNIDFHPESDLYYDHWTSSEFEDYLDFDYKGYRRRVSLTARSDYSAYGLNSGQAAAEIRGFARSNLSLHKTGSALDRETEEQIRRELKKLHKQFGDDVLFLTTAYAVTAKKKIIDTVDLVHIAFDLPFTGSKFYQAGVDYFDAQTEIERYASLDNHLDQQRLILSAHGGKITARSFSLLDGYRHQGISALPPAEVLVHLAHCTSIVTRQVLHDFEELINWRSVSEEDIHQFITKNPSLLLGDQYVALRSKLVLEQGDRGDLIPDFFAELAVSNYSDIVELKLPKEPLVVGINNRRRLSSAVHSAIEQLRTYGRYFEERTNRQRFHARYGVKAFRPNLSVIIGRAPPLDRQEEFMEAKSSLFGVNVMTYDDILARAQRRVLTISGSASTVAPTSCRK